MAGALEIPITLAHARGAYTATARFGEQAEPANLVLDTGSSTLALHARTYDPDRDGRLQATPWVQEIRYGGGALAGPVLRSRLAFGHGHHQRAIEDAVFALIESDTPFLQGADGLWGLAYRGLDPAYDVSSLLASQGHEPALSWPWPYGSGHDLDLARFDQFVHTLPRTHLTPAFTALEAEGVLRNRFGFLARRSLLHMAGHDGGPAHDPLNQGVLVLGGGEAQQHLHDGHFQAVRIVHDLHYDANLRAVQVGTEAPIPVPPFHATGTSGPQGNALLDTGSSFLILESEAWRAVMAAFARHDARFPALVERGRAGLAPEAGLPNIAIDCPSWPDLHLVLEAPGGGESRLRIPASAYWQHNALQAGRCQCLLAPQLPDFPGRSILGLPLFAGRYAVFDRAAAGGIGEVRLAGARGAG